MPNKKTAKRQIAFNNADGYQQVTLALPLAREILVGGYTFDPHPCLGHPTAAVEYLTGHQGPVGLNDKQETLLFEAIQAAYALGTAVGLLLRPDAFDGQMPNLNDGSIGGAK
jgi:hypothetical protein